MKKLKSLDEFVNESLDEGKIEINNTIKTSNKEHTFYYQTGKAAAKTAKEINKKLNDIGIQSFILKSFGDVIAVPTKDAEKAVDDILSTYDNLKQFAYQDGK